MSEDLHFWKTLSKSLTETNESFDDLCVKLSNKEQEYEELQRQLNDCVRDLILLNAMLLLKCEEEEED